MSCGSGDAELLSELQSAGPAFRAEGKVGKGWFEGLNEFKQPNGMKLGLQRRLVGTCDVPCLLWWVHKRTIERSQWTHSLVPPEHVQV